jgi:lysophospholipase L1-like esterase
VQTTEVFVEQVLLGLAALLALLLPFHPEWLHELPDPSLESSAAILAAAYLLGVLVDRGADSLTGGLERRGRLAFSARLGQPLREDRLALQALSAGDAVAARAEYLRSRFRLARGLLALLPAVTVAAALAASTSASSLARDTAVLTVTAAIYVITVSVSEIRQRAVPRTEQLSRYVTAGALRPEFGAWRDVAVKGLGAILALAAIVVLLPLRDHPPAHVAPRLGIVALGAALTAFAGWSHWRIRMAFMALLRTTAAAGPHPSTMEDGMDRDIRICAIGDSLLNGTGDPEFRGWIGRACEAARRGDVRITLYNLGVRRSTIADVLRRWRPEAESRLEQGPGPEFERRLIFGLGLSDAFAGTAADEALEAAADLLAAAKATGWPVLVVGPTPIHVRRVEEQGRPDASGILDRARRLASELEATCRHLGVPYVDAHARLAESERWRGALARTDGVHPGADGYQCLAEAIAGTAEFRRWLGT